MYGSTFGEIVMIMKNKVVEPRSSQWWNSSCLTSMLFYGKSMNSSFLILTIGRFSEWLCFFGLVKVNSLREGKQWFQTSCNSLKKLTLCHILPVEAELGKCKIFTGIYNIKYKNMATGIFFGLTRQIWTVFKLSCHILLAAKRLCKWIYIYIYIYILNNLMNNSTYGKGKNPTVIQR